MTSPSPTPRFAKPPATSSDTRSMSAYVTDQPPSVTYALRSPNRFAAPTIVSARVVGDGESVVAAGDDRSSSRTSETMNEAYTSPRNGDRGRRRRTDDVVPGTPARTRELRAQGRKTMRRLLDAGM